MITQENYRDTEWLVSLIAIKYQKGRLNFDSAIQRGIVWNKKRSSSYIYNIFRGIASFAAPALASKKIFDKENDIYGWDIIDGKQRMTSILSYLNNDFSLTGLEDRPLIRYEGKNYSINGKTYSKLPVELQEYFTQFQFKVVELFNATTQDEAEFFDGLNSGVAMSKMDMARCKSDNMQKIIQFRKHKLFTAMFSNKLLQKLPQDEIVIKAYMAITETNPDFSAKHYTEIMGDLVLSDEDVTRLNNVFNIVFMAYGKLKMNSSDAISMVLKKTHFLSYISYVENFESIDSFANWLDKFFTNLPDIYVVASQQATNSTQAIETRMKCVKQSITEYLCTKTNCNSNLVII